jgi:hypothetical protein
MEISEQTINAAKLETGIDEEVCFPLAWDNLGTRLQEC